MTQENETEKSYEDYWKEFNDPKPGTEPEKQEELEEPAEEKQAETELSEKEVDKPKEEVKETEKPEASESEKSDEERSYEALLDKTKDPELRKEIQLLLQKERSQRGRVSALTKKLTKVEELYQNALKAAEQQQAAPRSEAAPASTAPEQGRKKDPELSPELAAVKEKHPALYKALQELSRTEAQANAEKFMQDVDNRIKPVEESNQKQAYQKEADRLESLAGELFDTESTGVTVRDVITSKDFSAWLRSQPNTIQSIYKNASSADEAILVLTKFENDYQYMKKINSQLANDTSAQTEKVKEPETSKGDDLKKRREATQKAAVTPAGKVAAASSADNMDYDKIFDHFWGEKGIHRTRRSNG